MENTDKKNFPLYKAVGLVGLLLLVIGISIVSYNESQLIDRERLYYKQVLSTPPLELIETRTRESNTLNSYAVLDKDAKIYRIPITRAMEIKAGE